MTGSASLTKYISRHLTIKDSLTLHKYALTDIRKKCRKKYEWRSEGIKQFKELISSRNLLTWPFINLCISPVPLLKNELDLKFFPCIRRKKTQISLRKNI